jgi:predicted regulator of Ras-like GTPase activity (Roadblock/LC7/MglB family)
MVKPKRNIQETSEEFNRITVERTASEDSVRAMLEEIKSFDGVIGYILRNTNSAAIDLGDPSKIIDYATLSSSAFEACDQLSELFDLGEVKNIIVEGKDTKTLHATIGENHVSVFMEKNADAKKILERMQMP